MVLARTRLLFAASVALSAALAGCAAPPGPRPGARDDGAAPPGEAPYDDGAEPEDIPRVSGPENVTYQSGAFTHRGYLCKPPGSGLFPGVVFNHGGLGQEIGGDLEGMCLAIAKEGYVGFSPVRRQTVPLDGHLDDALAAVEYLKTIPEVDDTRLAFTGFSRGGLLTFMAAVHRADYLAVVLMAPAPAGDTLERYLPQAGNVSAPVLVLVAENDVYQADHVKLTHDVEDALRSAGKEVRLIQYPPFGDDGHELFFEVRGWWEDVAAFLDEELAG